MSKPLVSIIIPCYNQGHFIQDALDSVALCAYSNTEVIIVNDGSTSNETNTYLEKLKTSGYHVIFQENIGLGGARNRGIVESSGEYILPLDADNKIRPGYIERAVNHLVENENSAVVYGNSELFGAQRGMHRPGKFNLQKLMLGNYIDACAIIRKAVLTKVGLYDNMRIMGYEDWDLWLKIAFAGYDFYYLDEVLFDYRVVDGSMMRSLNADIARQNEIEEYFSCKYSNKLDFDYVENRIIYQLKKNPISNLYRLILKNLFPNYFNKKVQENKIYKYLLYDRKTKV